MRNRVKHNDMFRFIEKCLYNYPSNLARIEVLSEDLRVLRAYGDVHSPLPQLFFNASNAYTDPVSSHVDKVQRLEAQIRRLERITAPITKLLKNIDTFSQFAINQEYKQLLELFYFGGASLSEIACELHMSRSTLFRRRRGLVRKVSEYYNN